MAVEDKKLKCGDSEYCEECRNKKIDSGSNALTEGYLTQNMLGRCDFYMGPRSEHFSPESRSQGL